MKIEEERAKFERKVEELKAKRAEFEETQRTSHIEQMDEI